jgi:hypothetical protein
VFVKAKNLLEFQERLLPVRAERWYCSQPAKGIRALQDLVDSIYKNFSTQLPDLGSVCGVYRHLGVLQKRENMQVAVGSV